MQIAVLVFVKFVEFVAVFTNHEFHDASEPQPKTWRFFASSRLRGKACHNPPRRHEDAKNHEAFSISREILSKNSKGFSG